MIELTIEIHNAEGKVVAASSDTEQVYLFYKEEYVPGDKIVLKSSEAKVFLVIQLDDAMNPAFVYLADKQFSFEIPFAEKKDAYSPRAFSGTKHLMTARVAKPEEINAYKNLAKNEYDHHNNSACFPHAHANVETRNESVFAARNAIDGNFANHSHGKWPLESWGINKRDDAEITIEFGRTVEIDKIVLTLRADFPHDNYWERVTFRFSDGSRHVADLVKTHKPQTINIEKRRVEWVTLCELIKSDDPSPFPALTQIEVYGNEVFAG